MAKIHHFDLFGVRAKKYQWLLQNDLTTTGWDLLDPQAPFYLFIPQNTQLLAEYEHGCKISEVFLLNSTGVKTHRDHFALDFDHQNLEKKVNDFRNLNLEDSKIRELYDLPDTRDWKMGVRRKSLSNAKDHKRYFVKCLYRPFDIREIYYSPDVIELPRPEIMTHILFRTTISLMTTRKIDLQRGWEHIFASQNIIDHHSVSLKETNYIFALYLYPDPEKSLGEKKLWPLGKESRQPNLSPEFIKEFSARLRLVFDPILSAARSGRGPISDKYGPEDFFDYVYAVFHSPEYRKRYAEFLKIDFPRVPFISNQKLFRRLCELGAELVKCHLLEDDWASRRLARTLEVKYPIPGKNLIEKGYPKYSESRVWINKDQYFEGVPQEAWEFFIGGYQVAEKWLKDRRGRELSHEELSLYPKIIMALSETIRLMAEINLVIEKHGGWPIK